MPSTPAATRCPHVGRKMPSTKRPAEDAEGSKKKRSGSNARTGQACDRCKVRKIRCDAKLGGCSPCLQNNSECKTTDRITGRATSRGYTESIENEIASLRLYTVELQQQLREHGVDPKQPPALPQAYIAAGECLWSQWDNAHSNGYQYGQGDRNGSQGSLLSDFRPGCIGDNYLGVSSGNSWLTSIEGSSLSLFGAKIDLTEFMSPDLGSASSAMSYQSFLTHAFGGAFVGDVPPLPHWEQCKLYVGWYFRSIQPFIPILHKPDFMRLLGRIYHEGYRPSTAETVIVHMVLTVIMYQYSARNTSDSARDESFNHFHYSLSFVPELIKGHTLQDMQALTLICSQLRNFPRPGAAWMFTSLVLSLAIELGLHRSATAWQGSHAEKDPHIIEMRKRVFWTLMAFHVHVGGKLGRPMPLRMEDFDLEFPEPIHDNLPEEANLSKWRKCSFRASIYGFRLLKILMQIYGNIYSLRSTNTMYEAHVKQLGKELQLFRASVPPEITGGPQTKEEDRVSALYLQLSAQECQLLLHHPSLCRSSSPQVTNSHMDICLDASKQMLDTATQLQVLKSLDTTLYYNMDFLAAIFTTLFTWTERRDQIKSEDLQSLRRDMDAWLGVMGDLGHLLGTGPRLQNALRGIIDWSLNTISRHLAAKTASAAVASAGSPTQQQQQQTYDPGQHYSDAYGSTANDSATISNVPQQAETYPLPAEAAEHFAYPDPHTSTLPPYNGAAANMAAFDPNAYTSDVKPNMETQLLSSQPAPANFLAAFQSHSDLTPSGYQPVQSGPSAWRHFADSMMTNMGTGDYMQPASTLMSMGGALGGQQAGTQSWPLNLYGSDGQ